jgi:hypothetical protein
MHGWGHAQNKGVIYPNLGNVPESQTDSSGFPTRKGMGLGWDDGFAPDGVSGRVLFWLAGEMGSFGKNGFGAALEGGHEALG